MAAMLAWGAEEANRLAPAGEAEARQPLPHPGQRLDPARHDQLAVARLLGVGDASDLGVGEVVAEQVAQDRVVAATEGGEELLAARGGALAGEGVQPGEPVVLLGVEQRAVHVPEDAARRAKTIGHVDVVSPSVVRAALRSERHPRRMRTARRR
jgi:hypothetical protein